MSWNILKVCEVHTFKGYLQGYSKLLYTIYTYMFNLSQSKTIWKSLWLNLKKLINYSNIWKKPKLNKMFSTYLKQLCVVQNLYFHLLLLQCDKFHVCYHLGTYVQQVSITHYIAFKSWGISRYFRQTQGILWEFNQ